MEWTTWRRCWSSSPQSLGVKGRGEVKTGVSRKSRHTRDLIFGDRQNPFGPGVTSRPIEADAARWLYLRFYSSPVPGSEKGTEYMDMNAVVFTVPSHIVSWQSWHGREDWE